MMRNDRQIVCDLREVLESGVGVEEVFPINFPFIQRINTPGRFGKASPCGNGDQNLRFKMK
ncbi:MAG: hypothetical protein OXM55_01040 [Bdellovibrionales bacterium]|nr:hypothetical protein [Bdellovibrionales bacterium]